ncbi:MAG: dihydroorotate dehydrogenase 2 [Planctomycetota bacterium]|nr:dihydroorotate dehydrogenase 2 [Planctomycetota bacterium]
MGLYEWLFPLARLLPAERAHELGHWALKLPLPLGGGRVEDPFEWSGLRFPNRVGLAAGFDKNAAVLDGIARMGVGFVEVGTILSAPWPGNPPPRMSRREDERAIWNRLGFPNEGVARVAQRMERFRARNRSGLILASNVAPHPRTVKAGGEGFLAEARSELAQLAHALHAVSDLFVINLSSPNTKGLRDLLYGPGFRDELILPLREALSALDAEADRPEPTPLLVKLPPEDGEGVPWTEESLAPCLEPLRAPGACDGFVAVNTSIGLARARGASPDEGLPGGLSGVPLRPLAESTLRLLASARRPEHLLVGVGGVDEPGDALALRAAGADLVEVYTGMIYHGPRFPGACARALAER